MSTAHIDIHHVARLARIALTEDEAAQMSVELDRMLKYFGSIQDVALAIEDPAAGREPTPTALRPDVAGPTLDRAEALAGAPAHDGSAFTVPRVV